MTEYVFADMTAGQAADVGAGDVIFVHNDTASRTTVLFNENFTYTVTIHDKTLTFGAGFRGVVNATPQSGLVFDDGSVLKIGDSNANSFELTPNLNVQTNGAAYGGAGDDTFRTFSGDWLIQGNQGADTITTAGGNNTIYGGQDNDRISLVAQGVNGFPSGRHFAQGNKGDDTVIGAGKADTLLGGQGNDAIDGQGGQDFLNGNLGNDSITGNGQLLGEGGNDTLAGGTESTNTISGGDGDDQISAGVVVVGGVNRGAVNTIFGDDGNDFIRSTSPLSDTLSGGAGNDVVSSSGNDPDQGDVLNGDDGDDVLVAQVGADRLRGGAGSDSLSGNDGNDTLDGGAGADTLSGGAGADVYALTAGTGALTLAAADCIVDWQSADHIQLRGPATGYVETTAADFNAALASAQTSIGNGSAEVVAVQVGGDVIVFADASAGATIDVAAVLVGRSLADIAGDTFI